VSIHQKHQQPLFLSLLDYDLISGVRLRNNCQPPRHVPAAYKNLTVWS
jgi:hypothetical protein